MSKKLSDEITDLFTDLGSVEEPVEKSVVEEAVVTEESDETIPAVVEDASPEEVPPEEVPPVEEAPVEEPPAEVPPEPPVEEVPEEETREELLARIGLLQNRVEELTVLPGEVPSVLPVVEASVPEVTPPVQPVVPEVPAVPTTIDFLGEATIDDVLDSKEKLNELLNQVVARASGIAERGAHEKVLLSIPNLVLGHINRQTTLTKMVDTFYEVNKDLVPVRKTVGAVANNIHAEHPDWEIEAVFKEAAVKTREVLGMKKSVARQVVEADMASPAFGKSGGGKARVAVGKTVADEIADLFTDND